MMIRNFVKSHNMGAEGHFAGFFATTGVTQLKDLKCHLRSDWDTETVLVCLPIIL